MEIFKLEKRKGKNLNPLLTIRDEYVIGGAGFHISGDGSLKWSNSWKHWYDKGYLFPDHHLFVINEISHPAPAALVKAGACAIDLEDGHIRWRHTFEQLSKDNHSVFEEMDISANYPIINPQHYTGKYLISPNTIVDIETGDYRPRNTEETFEHKQEVDPLPELSFPKKKGRGRKRLDLKGGGFTVPGYNFGEHSSYWKRDHHLLVPAYSDNSSFDHVRLFEVEPTNVVDERSWELPKNKPVCGIVPFPGGGILVRQASETHEFLTHVKLQ